MSRVLLFQIKHRRQKAKSGGICTNLYPVRILKKVLKILFYQYIIEPIINIWE